MAIIPNGQKESLGFETPQEAKQKKMIYLLILILAVAAAIIYFGFFRTPAIPVEAPAQAEPNGNLKLFESLKNTNLDSPVFKDKRFERLNVYGQFPIVIGAKGRGDPFAPF